MSDRKQTNLTCLSNPSKKVGFLGKWANKWPAMWRWYFAEIATKTSNSTSVSLLLCALELRLFSKTYLRDVFLAKNWDSSVDGWWIRVPQPSLFGYMYCIFFDLLLPWSWRLHFMRGSENDARYCFFSNICCLLGFSWKFQLNSQKNAPLLQLSEYYMCIRWSNPNPPTYWIARKPTFHKSTSSPSAVAIDCEFESC